MGVYLLVSPESRLEASARALSVDSGSAARCGCEPLAASVRVPDQDLPVHVQMDGAVINALTSTKAEHLLIQSIKASAVSTQPMQLLSL